MSDAQDRGEAIAGRTASYGLAARACLCTSATMALYVVITLAEAVLLVLRDARMSVSDRHLAWIVELIGREPAVECPSLARKVRVVEA